MTLNDEYFRDLPPQARRYDTPLGDSLVFSVFPNGTKCWVLIYSVGGFARRRTLGLFPEMKLDAAREAVAQARRILEAESELARSGEPTAASGRRSPWVSMLEDRPLLAVGLGLGFAALLGLAVVWLLG
ncbi:MAG TPA: Arm DNA-binding domain-containing protein [Gammaproteobacteria bacterium]|nr:Arm DNA-binding domain-containing protein [Gammaproteobacteria bacterium]